MKKHFLKLMLAALTFFIGVGVVGLWYLSRAESMSDKALSEAVLFSKFVVENPCDYPQPQSRELEPEEAVYAAECFVIQNGYTDLPPIADKSKLTPENVFPMIDEEGMEMRRDSLERKAYSYTRDNGFRSGGWMIMFRYKPRPKTVKFYGDRLNHIGRAVVMNFYGEQKQIRHSDYPLNIPDATVLNR